jgi:periplasmic divalent cation tolerance protein
MADEVLLVLSTFPDAATARRIGRLVVDEKVAACVNILPQVESIYRWQEKVEATGETLALFKTTAERFEALETTLRGAHPYEVPEIIAFKVEQGLPQYLRWVTDNCR